MTQEEKTRALGRLNESKQLYERERTMVMRWFDALKNIYAADVEILQEIISDNYVDILNSVKGTLREIDYTLKTTDVKIKRIEEEETDDLPTINKE
jgi:hypothetical protein